MKAVDDDDTNKTDTHDGFSFKNHFRFLYFTLLDSRFSCDFILEDSNVRER